MSITEWIYILYQYTKDRITDRHQENSDLLQLAYRTGEGSIKCPNCHLSVPCGPRCNICGSKLSTELYPIVKKQAKVNDSEDTVITTTQYSIRKKYQKIKCPYCNSLSKILKENTHGFQTRICKNDHVFTYNYESEMLVQNDLNAKYK